VAAWHNSRAGLRDIWGSEEAFRFEAILWGTSIPLAIWIAESAFQAAILIATGILVMIVEVLNSAIEATIDRIGSERHELSRMAKDLGSLAVLMSLGIWGLLWIAVVLGRFTGW
jgi:diacylglycerol kinase (ATP)